MEAVNILPVRPKRLSCHGNGYLRYGRASL